LDAAFEFADIAVPRVRASERWSPSRRTGRALALAYFGGTISTERRDVGGPRAPGRQMKVDHLQAKQQILAKAASDYLRSRSRLRVAISRRSSLMGGTADPIEFALPEGPRGSLAWRRCHAGPPPDPLARPDPSRCRRAEFAPPIPWLARAPLALRQGFVVAGRASESYAPEGPVNPATPA
jgi:hypothetical protein